MTIDEMKRANELHVTIVYTEQLIKDYCEADSIDVSLPRKTNHGMNYQGNMTTLSAAEIGDAVVAALESRAAKMRTELRELGVVEG